MFMTSSTLHLISPRVQWTASDRIDNRDYTMASGIDGVAADASLHRSLAGFINHSAQPNVSVSCVFERGCEQAIVVAAQRIARGEQLFHDYTDNFWVGTEAPVRELERKIELLDDR